MRPKHLQIKLKELKLAPSSDTGVMEFTGYGAVFDNVDAYGDVIQKSAFTAYVNAVKSGVQQWPVMLLQHGGWGVGNNDMTPVGIWTDMAEDDIGLKLTGRFADTQNGIECYQLVKMEPRPAITGLSIGYYALDVAYGGKNDNFDRLIKQIELLEISLVTFPANDKARVTGVKSAAEYTERDFERLMQDAGFTRKEARIILNDGFKSLIAKQDAGDQALKQLLASIECNTKILNN